MKSTELKVLFLDVDGVVCLDNRTFDPYLVPNLERIIRKTGCKIVVSSTWRNNPEALLKIKNMIKNCCGGEVIGVTISKAMPRIDQILLWVSENKPDKFIALDDNDLNTNGNPPGWLIKTETNRGLLYDQAELAIKKLLG